MSDLRLSLSTASVEVQPGDSVEVRLRVENSGPTQDSYIAEVMGLDPGWLFGDALSQFNLRAGEQRDLRLILQPPPAAASRAGLYKVGVRVTRTNDPARQLQPSFPATPSATTAALDAPLQGTAVLDLTVLPQPDFEVEIKPRHLDSRRANWSQVKIVNNGNMDLLFNVVITDDVQELEFHHPAQIGVHAGQTETFKLEMLPRKGKIMGGMKSYSYELTVTPSLGAGSGGSRPRTTSARRNPSWTNLPGAGLIPVTITGRYIHRPVLPAWLLASFPLLLGLLCVGLVAMLAYLGTEADKSASTTAQAFVSANTASSGSAAAATSVAAGSETRTVGVVRANQVTAIVLASANAAEQTAFARSNATQMVVTQMAETRVAGTQIASTQQAGTQIASTQQAEISNQTATAVANITAEYATQVAQQKENINTAEAREAATFAAFRAETAAADRAVEATRVANLTAAAERAISEATARAVASERAATATAQRFTADARAAQNTISLLNCASSTGDWSSSFNSLSVGGNGGICVSRLQARNFTLDVNVRFSKTPVEGGIVFRAQNPSNPLGGTYLVTLNSEGGTANNRPGVYLQKYISANRSERIGNGTTATINANTTYRLKITANGKELKVNIANIDFTIEREDTLFSDGFIGFYANGPAVFQDLRVTLQ